MNLAPRYLLPLQAWFEPTISTHDSRDSDESLASSLDKELRQRTGGHEGASPQNAAKLPLLGGLNQWWPWPKYIGISGPFCSLTGSNPVGDATSFKSLRGTATFGAGTKGHNSGANFWPGLPNRQCFRASGAVLIGTKRHMQFSQIRRRQPRVRETGE